MKRKDTSRMGAPKKAPELRKSYRVAVNIEEAVYEKIRQISEKEGKPIAVIGRTLIERALE